MSVFDSPAFDQHEGIHYFSDPRTGLRAIIAVHSTALGPAAGGCRLWTYVSEEQALTDVLRLSRGMSYKNAVAGLPWGGGKAVLLRDAKRPPSPAMFQAFGRAVHQLGGRYITAEDVGVSVADMQEVSRSTRYVAGLPVRGTADVGGDPSPHTANGVFSGIRAAVRVQLGRDDLMGLRVAVQGLGHVGWHLCEALHAAGAKLWVADLNSEMTERAAETFGATAVATDEILYQAVDVLAPCALGAVLNEQTIPRLQASIVAGAANNQLATDQDGARLLARDILYAPDYVINAGGIINVAGEYLRSMDAEAVQRKVAGIGDTLSEIFERARREAVPTHQVADAMAEQRMRDASPDHTGRASAPTMTVSAQGLAYA